MCFKGWNTWSKMIFLHSTNYTINSWRCHFTPLPFLKLLIQKTSLGLSLFLLRWPHTSRDFDKTRPKQPYFATENEPDQKTGNGLDYSKDAAFVGLLTSNSISAKWVRDKGPTAFCTKRCRLGVKQFQLTVIKSTEFSIQVLPCK